MALVLRVEMVILKVFSVKIFKNVEFSKNFKEKFRKKKLRRKNFPFFNSRDHFSVVFWRKNFQNNHFGDVIIDIAWYFKSLSGLPRGKAW